MPMRIWFQRAFEKAHNLIGDAHFNRQNREAVARNENLLVGGKFRVSQTPELNRELLGSEGLRFADLGPDLDFDPEA